MIKLTMTINENSYKLTGLVNSDDLLCVAHGSN